ncbi:Protein Wnt-4 [Aphelenchoides fujianensis]|nr:Protein Wnt-4 [Aphelenchoides fujianensis]
MPSSRRTLPAVLLASFFIHSVGGYWPLLQLATTHIPASNYFDCRLLPGLSRKQHEICKHNRHAVRAAASGLREAIDECKLQFASEKWNCTTKRGHDAAALQVASRESAYVYALTAGAVSRAVAKACALGQIPDCQCGDRPQQSSKNFIWAGCSDNVRYGNWFSRRFMDTTEKQRMDGRALMNLHNNRVTVLPEKSELILKPSSSRTERSTEASKAELVFLEKSPDFCAINSRKHLPGSSGRECFSEEKCHDLCCGRGWTVEHQWKNEPCRCKFEWCCEVKCQQCTKLVQRRFCR